MSWSAEHGDFMVTMPFDLFQAIVKPNLTTAELFTVVSFKMSGWKTVGFSNGL